MSKSVQFVLGLSALLLAGCGQEQETPNPLSPQITAEDYDDIVTCGDDEGADIDPPISDEQLAELKRVDVEGEATAPRPEARAEVGPRGEHFC